MRAAARAAQPALRSGPTREKDYTYELKLLNEALGRPTAGKGPAPLDDADRKLLRRGLHLVLYSQDGVTIPPELADHVTKLSRKLDLD